MELDRATTNVAAKKTLNEKTKSDDKGNSHKQKLLF